MKSPRLSLQLAVAVVAIVGLIQLTLALVLQSKYQQSLQAQEVRLSEKIRKRAGISLVYPLGESYRSEQVASLKNWLIVVNAIGLTSTLLAILVVFHLLGGKHLAQVIQLNKKVSPHNTDIPKLALPNNELGDLILSRQEMLQKLRDHQEKTEANLIEMRTTLMENSRRSTAGALTAAIARSVRNPVRQILDETSRLRETKLSGPLNESAQKVSQAAQQIHRLVEGMERVKESELPLSSGASLERIIQNALSILQPRITAQSISLVQSFPEEMPDFWGDETSLEQVLINLLSNAIESLRNSHHRTLTLDADYDEEYLILFIEDTGQGIKSENLENIFKPFYSTKPPGEGNGLGLSISKDIIDRHHGKIFVKSEVGQGTQFKIKLQRYPQASSTTADSMAA